MTQEIKTNFNKLETKLKDVNKQISDLEKSSEEFDTFFYTGKKDFDSLLSTWYQDKEFGHTLQNKLDFFNVEQRKVEQKLVENKEILKRQKQTTIISIEQQRSEQKKQVNK